MAQQPYSDLGLLTVTVSRSHAVRHAPHSVGFLWTGGIGPSLRPLPDNTQHLQQTDIYAAGGFEPVIPASERPQIYA